MTQLVSQSRQASAARERRPVVVCIDDDPAVLRSLRRVLRSDDYEVLTTGDPETALDRILRPPVDVFIADERMPGITGTDLLRVVEQQSPTTRRVIISAYPEAAGRVRSERSVVQHFIPKPWNDELLKAIVRRMTSTRPPDPVPEAPAERGFMKEIPLLADCAGRKIFHIVPRILKLLRRARREGRSILVILEDLGQLRDDPGALLADIELGVTASNVDTILVDRSGLALRYARLRGSASPLMSVHGPARTARSFLLVDPATPRRVFLKLLLGGLGHSCRAAATIAEGRALAEREAFDRILVDLGDAHDSMDWIEEISAGGKGLRIVPLLPASRHWDPAVFERWQLQAPMIRPYSFREVLGLSL